ncbi:MAG: rod shape-determining protein MreC [Rubrobacteridae bacterium]|nr:rod shape-determining protein MreC [Rubrobacteridae bacterium]
MPEFFGRRNYLILFVLISISIVILTAHARENENGPIHVAQRLVLAVISPVQSTVTTIVSPIKDGWDYLIHFGQLTRENRDLRKQLAESRSEVSELKNYKSENSRLRKLIDFKNQSDFKITTANVIGMPSSSWWSSIVIDRGTHDGIKRGMPVVSGGGLIGQITDASGESARVLLLNDSDSGVSVQVKRTGEFGIIHGQINSTKLTLRNISRDSTIRKGDQLHSSGLGGIFPKGIYVGKVTGINQTPYGLFKTVEVSSPVDFVKLREVMIIKSESGLNIKGVK